MTFWRKPNQMWNHTLFMLHMVRAGNGMFQMAVDVESKETKIGVSLHLVSTCQNISNENILCQQELKMYSYTVNHVSCSPPRHWNGEEPEQSLDPLPLRFRQVLQSVQRSLAEILPGQMNKREIFILQRRFGMNSRQRRKQNEWTNRLLLQLPHVSLVQNLRRLVRPRICRRLEHAWMNDFGGHSYSSGSSTAENGSLLVQSSFSKPFSVIDRAMPLVWNYRDKSELSIVWYSIPQACKVHLSIPKVINFVASKNIMRAIKCLNKHRYWEYWAAMDLKQQLWASRNV